MVYRVYVEKKEAFKQEANSLLHDIQNLLGISKVKAVRVINRYDIDGIDEKTLEAALHTVLSEPQVDDVYRELPEEALSARVFAVESLPGQFDQRADSAGQCIQFISCGERPPVRFARVFLIEGDIKDADLKRIKEYVINPVEAREASLEIPETLEVVYETPEDVAILDGFNEMLPGSFGKYIKDYGLAMDEDDLAFVQEYFKKEGRNPSLTELKVIDTYWSDHCRHTTFNTIIDSVKFEDEILEETWNDYLATRQKLGRDKKPLCLMDLGTIGAKYLKEQGLLDKIDESEEINACSIRITVDHDGVDEPWILMFKNETHNHPTEIEPFGGAATCIGGAIRDPLSGRSYVYAAMRVTGAADPTVSLKETREGKLPQRTIVTKAASGYSSYGNQIGLATGIVDELYHPGYAAKRMEVGAVIAAAPEENIRREVPAPGDVIIYLGGSTGRDGIGGATGSSKAHDSHSVETCGAEVQKGNAPEERKLQRLFRIPQVAKMIKRCNDFGAGGVSVAIGELAPGLDINLDLVPKKYEGLDGTELAISESQERMAVVVAAKNEQEFLAFAQKENLQAVRVACVTNKNRLVMNWRGKAIVDISREFLDTNGAPKHIDIVATAPALKSEKYKGSFTDTFLNRISDLNSCSKRMLSERFDSTIGAGSVLMPFGGECQLTPVQCMVNKISVEKGDTSTVSYMSWGFNPYLSEESPYHGAYLAVVESVAKLIAAGASYQDIYLSFQEYFEKLGKNPQSWGKTLSALLGAFRAQKELGVGAIGGKDSMSGTFEDIHVPPTLISFAVTTGDIDYVVSNELKNDGSTLVKISPAYGKDGLPHAASLRNVFNTVEQILASGMAVSAYACGCAGVAEAAYKMSLGNVLGIAFDNNLELDELFGRAIGTFILELEDGIEIDQIMDYITEGDTEDGEDAISVTLLGVTTIEGYSYRGEDVLFGDALEAYEGKLEGVYGFDLADEIDPKTYTSDAKPLVHAALGIARPRVLIPVFPGTNCEFDSAKAFERAGAEPDIFVIKNLSADDIAHSIEECAKRINQSQMIFIPGGFSGGDEPDGSAKFICSFFRNEAVKNATHDLLKKRDGLMAGVCNGFQALIKLGLVPYGEIIEPDEEAPTLTFNTIARHQSKIVQVRVASKLSPWLKRADLGGVYNVPISHGEGRFMAPRKVADELVAKGQIAMQYVDLARCATYDIESNPNGSIDAIEGITSPDGRVLGKMGHAERIGAGLYKNVPGEYDMKMFESAVEYFK